MQHHRSRTQRCIGELAQRVSELRVANRDEHDARGA
jgi:hypothetical protein